MSIKDLYQSGQKKQDIGHFASLVKVLKSNSDFNDSQKELLARYAIRLNISEQNAEYIFKNPDEFPIAPPVSLDDRLERLYNLTRMVFLDGFIDKQECQILERVLIGLGFSTEHPKSLILRAGSYYLEGLNLEEFTRRMKRDF